MSKRIPVTSFLIRSFPVVLMEQSSLGSPGKTSLDDGWVHAFLEVLRSV